MINERTLTHNKLRVELIPSLLVLYSPTNKPGFKKEEDIKSGFAMHISFSFRQTWEDYTRRVINLPLNR